MKKIYSSSKNELPSEVRKQRDRRFKSILASGLLYSLAALTPSALFAEGSKDLYPDNTGNSVKKYRSYLMSRSSQATAHFAPFQSKGTHKVFVKSGEKLHLGHSAYGKGTGAIVVRDPQGVVRSPTGSVSGNTNGLILNREQEKAGPKVGANNPNGYTPLTIEATSTGIWEVDFVAPGDGTNFVARGTTPIDTYIAQFEVDKPFYDTHGADNGRANALLAAWDVTVQAREDEGGALLTGRVFTSMFIGTGFNSEFQSKSWYGGFYVLTKDGYAYKVDANGLNGASFSFFSTNKGNIVQGTSPLRPSYESFSYTSGSYSTQVTPKLLNPLLKEENGNISNKLFYNKPDKLMPAETSARLMTVNGTTTSYENGTTWLHTSPVIPRIKNLRISCNGVVKFTPTHTTRYEITFSTADGKKRVVTDDCVAGVEEVYTWDKIFSDNSQIGANTRVTVSVRYRLGEVHFPYIDAETNWGGIKVQSLDENYEPDVLEPTYSTIYHNDKSINNSAPDYSTIGEVAPNGGHKWNSTNSSLENATSSLGETNTFGNNTVIDTWKYVETLATETASIMCLEYYISGNVWNDVNGDAAKAAAGELPVSGSVADENVASIVTGSTIFATLTNASGVVIQSVPVETDGSYLFTGVPSNTSYKVVLTKDLSTVGSSVTVSSLPDGWASTGTNISGTASTANKTGIINLGNLTDDLENRNFAIQQGPTPVSVVLDPRENLSGDTFHTITPTSFRSTDEHGGTISSITITSFPSNANAIQVGTTKYYPNAAAIPASCTGCQVFPVNGITVPVTNGVPAQAILVDPVDGLVKVDIPFKSTDNAGTVSSTTGTVTVPFHYVTIEGNVWNDLDGDAIKDSGENPISGTNASSGTSIAAGSPLYASVVDASGNVIKTVQVAADGSYFMTDIPMNESYKVILTIDPQTVGGTLTEGTLPTDWVATGVNSENTSGTGVPNTTIKNGVIDLGLVSKDVKNADFGIQQAPKAGIVTQPIEQNPSGTTFYPILASSFLASDQNGGTISSIRITEFPAGADAIRINGQTYTAGNFPTEGISIAFESLTNGTVEVDPKDGNLNVVLAYTVTDNGGLTSPVGSVTQPFGILSIAGKVWNDLDADAVTDGTEQPISGDNTNTNGGGSVVTHGQVYANLVNSEGEVVASTQVNADGTYLFSNVTGGEAYQVVVSTEPVANGTALTTSTLPTGWAATGTTTQSGADAANKTGIINLGVVNAHVTVADFGIQQPPVAEDETLASKANPSGVHFYTIPASSFESSDPNGGTVVALTITSFPSNTTSITIGESTYSASSFPVGGVIIPTNTNGEPTLTVSVDPIDGNVNVVIPFTVTDNGGLTSTPASVIQPFATISIAGKVWYDIDGDGVVDNTEKLISGTTAGSSTVETTGGTIFANLVDASGNVVASVPVGANGEYLFSDVTPGVAYKVVMTTVAQAVNSPVSALDRIPTGWVATGVSTQDGQGANIADVTNKSGEINLGTVTSDVQEANFGIQLPPVSDNSTYTLSSQPTAGTVIKLDNTVAAQGGGNLNILDLDDDGLTDLGVSVRFTALPTVSGGTPSGSNPVLLYNGDPVTLNQQIADFDPTKLSIRLEGEGYTSTNFKFVVVDAAGAQSTEATYTINFPSGSLPVQFVSVNARLVENQVSVNWSTAKELNSSYFELERKVGSRWDGIARVNAKTNSNAVTNYSIIDKTPLVGINYYRVKAVDLDGTFEYSKLVSVSNVGKISVYPNPAQDYIQLTVQDISSVKNVSVLDVTGTTRLNLSRSALATTDKVSVSGLATGIYVVIIELNSGEVITQRLLINK